MNGKQFVTVLTRRWRVAVSGILAVLVLGSVLLLLTPPTYASTSELFVSTSTEDNVTQLYQGGQFSSDRVKSYAELATSPQVTIPVAQAQSPPMSPESLSSEISAEAPANTVLVDIRVEDPNAQQSAILADAVARQLAAVISAIEAPSNSRPSPVRATVVSAPSIAPVKTSPIPWLYLSVSLVVGFGVGIGLALAREATDSFVRTPADLRSITDRTVMAELPQLQNSVEDNSTEARASEESFKRLRTSIQFAALDERPRVLLVASASSGDGKTTTAIGLARTLHDAGNKVCLVDADLRKPSVAERLAVSSEVGVTSVLLGRVDVRNAVQRSRFGFYTLAAGPLPPNPSEILGSVAMRDLTVSLRSSYDYVLLDSAPLLPVTDSVVLASVADGALLVVNASRSTKKSVELALRELETSRINIMGVCLNQARVNVQKEYGYRYAEQESVVNDNSTAVTFYPHASAEEQVTRGDKPTPSRRMR